MIIYRGIWFARIWSIHVRYPYMNIYVYDTHIWVGFPMWCMIAVMNRSPQGWVAWTSRVCDSRVRASESGPSMVQPVRSHLSDRRCGVWWVISLIADAKTLGWVRQTHHQRSREEVVTSVTRTLGLRVVEEQCDCVLSIWGNSRKQTNASSKKNDQTNSFEQTRKN